MVGVGFLSLHGVTAIHIHVIHARSIKQAGRIYTGLLLLHERRWSGWCGIT
jgi:hypothetical protein